MISHHRHAFSFADEPPKALGGALCLDFINTVGWRGDPSRRIEFLPSYSELVHWTSSIRALQRRTAYLLLRTAATDVEKAAVVMSLATQLRKELEGAFDPALLKPSSLPVSTSVVRMAGSSAMLTLEAGESHQVWSWKTESPELSLPLLPVALSALELATSTRRALVKRCHDQNCAWVFVDETRNQSRRWCSMEDCGNRAKVNAHYARRKLNS